MKNTSTARLRTLALLLAATALPVTPVVAQEAVAKAVPYKAAITPAVLVVKPAASSMKKSKAAKPGVGDERPRIGISLQATGSNARGQTDLVEYNLIVKNADEVVARDVEVSTFLIDGRVKSSETETSLIDPVGETQSRFIDLAPGTSVPIASTLSVPHGTDPCIIAEARYPLPGGGEGHIAARFIIEATNGDIVEARLGNVLERV